MTRNYEKKCVLNGNMTHNPTEDVEKKKDGRRRKRPLHLPPVISNRRSSRKRSPEESYLYAVGSPPAFRWTG